MVFFNDALDTVLSVNNQLQTESVLLHECNGRVLAENIYSDTNFPPFDKAAMDGYAIKLADINKELDIIDTIAAGFASEKTIQTGQAAKIMTGAPVPKGADFVIQVELSEQISPNKVKFTRTPTNNIIYKAEHITKGELVLSKLSLLDARHIAILAATGYASVNVVKQPTVGIISTGSEIVEPEFTPKPTQIRNSNGHQLIQQVIQSQAIPKYYGIVGDTFEETHALIEKGITECDILLITGGVSMGEFDFVPDILTKLGVIIHFNRIAVKPGKPTIFGTKNNKVIFGLPGNPVSSFIQFEVLVKPLIYKFMGARYQAKYSRHVLSETYSRKKSNSTAHIPVTIKQNKVYFSNYKGSSHIHALTNSSGFVTMEPQQSEFKEGDFVDVRLF